jgi:hypothetical protein
MGGCLGIVSPPFRLSETNIDRHRRTVTGPCKVRHLQSRKIPCARCKFARPPEAENSHGSRRDEQAMIRQSEIGDLDKFGEQ